jgi:hypothetical protein
MSMPDFSVDYIVRIYRFKRRNPRHLVGVVEEVGTKVKKAFTNYDELWEIMISSKSVSPNQKQKKKEMYNGFVGNSLPEA